MWTFCCKKLADLVQSIVELLHSQVLGIYWIVNSWPWDHWPWKLVKVAHYQSCPSPLLDECVAPLWHPCYEYSTVITVPHEMHLWYKFCKSSYKYSQVIAVTSKYDLKVTNLERASQGHWWLKLSKFQRWTSCAKNVADVVQSIMELFPAGTWRCVNVEITSDLNLFQR